VKAESLPGILGLMAGSAVWVLGLVEVLTDKNSRLLQPPFPEHKDFFSLLDPGSPVAVFVDPVETAAQIF
jgi:hypothetical protein